MSATYQTVTISGIDYEVYADVASADLFLNADPNADTWRLADTDTKGRALVSATRVLNVQPWAGTPTYPYEALAWPRTGVVANGIEVDPDIIPEPVIQASIVLANLVLNGVDIVNFTTTATVQKRIKAGPVEVENFRLTTLQAPTYPLPQEAWLLIAPYTGGAGASARAQAFGTDGCSILDRPFTHSVGF